MAAPLQPLIQSHILSLRNQRVMLDADLAQLYGVDDMIHCPSQLTKPAS